MQTKETGWKRRQYASLLRDASPQYLVRILFRAPDVCFGWKADRLAWGGSGAEMSILLYHGLIVQSGSDLARGSRCQIFALTDSGVAAWWANDKKYQTDRIAKNEDL